MESDVQTSTGCVVRQQLRLINSYAKHGELKVLDTWGGRSEFDFVGNINQGTIITYGSNNQITVTAQQYQAMLEHFRGQTITVRPERTTPEHGSLELWLRNNVTQTAIASYVAPILINEGVATRSTDNRLQFNA